MQLYVKTKGNIKYEEDEPIESLSERKGCEMQDEGDMNFIEDDKVNGEYWRSEGILVLPPPPKGRGKRGTAGKKRKRREGKQPEQKEGKGKRQGSRRKVRRW